MITNSLKARAARNTEEAKYEPKRRLVSGTEPEKMAAQQYNQCRDCLKRELCPGYVSGSSECRQRRMGPMSNTSTNKDVAKSTLRNLIESFDE